MATRYYLPSTGAAAVSPAYSASWGSTTPAARLKCVTTRISSAMTNVTTGALADPSALDVLIRQYVSDPIGAQTITGTIAGQIRAMEDFGSTTALTVITVTVVSNDGSTVRGTLLAETVGATDFATTLTNRFLPTSTAVSSVVAENNDRLVIEIGNRVTGGGARETTLNIGDNSGSDLGSNETDTAANNPWVEFSHNFTPPGPTITVQPVADTVILTNETTASFSVTATGTGGLTYDWELETGVSSGVYANVADGSGATWTGQAAASLSATLTAKTLTGRRVRCNVTDTNGTTTTNAVALTIYDGPQLTTFPATNASGVSTATLTSDYVTGTGEFVEVAIVLSDGRVAVTTTVTA